MARIICLDIGTVRIGVAVSDPLGFFAQGIAVWKADSDWITELGKLFEQYDTSCLLVGLPLLNSGEEGSSAKMARDAAAAVTERFPMVSVKMWDERFSTAIATSYLLEGDVSRKKRKKSVDKIAAAVILQSYMDAYGTDSF